VAARDKSPEIDSNWIALAEVELRMDSRADALAAIKQAVELNPANERQLPLNAAFHGLLDDLAFKKLTSD
jgi:cytochrome c-type biogenesis protein CcmH/NrfG